jgi:hypothetical protein
VAAEQNREENMDVKMKTAIVGKVIKTNMSHCKPTTSLEFLQAIQTVILLEVVKSYPGRTLKQLVPMCNEVLKHFFESVPADCQETLWQHAEAVKSLSTSRGN